MKPLALLISHIEIAPSSFIYIYMQAYKRMSILRITLFYFCVSHTGATNKLSLLMLLQTQA